MRDFLRYIVIVILYLNTVINVLQMTVNDTYLCNVTFGLHLDTKKYLFYTEKVIKRVPY